MFEHESPSGAPALPDYADLPIGRIHFRSFRAGNEPAIRRVLDRSFERWPPFEVGASPDDFIRWFAEGWGPGRGDVHVAELGGRIVAVSLAFLRPLRLGGDTVIARQGAYGAVDPDVRRGGVARQFVLWRDAQPTQELSWGFTQVEALQRSRNVRGTVASANPIDVSARVLRPLRAAREARRGWSGAPSYAALAALGLLRNRGSSPAKGISEVTRFDDRTDSLWSAAANEFDYIPWAGAGYLNWRYFDPRAGSSLGLVAEGERGKLLGYAVLRFRGARAHVGDLLALPTRTDVAASLLRGAVRAALHAGSAAVECTLPRAHPFSSALRSTGFVRLAGRSAEMTRRFGVTPTRIDVGRLGMLADPSGRIHVTLGDSDLI